MADRYDVPALLHRAEQTIDRSRFIATLARAATADEARAVIDAVRAAYPDATHHCWAFVAGPPGSTAVIGMSDAGEPHGTAGRPMLDVLLHSGVGDVAAVVTRYYGGVRLGTGGLVRAYGGAVQHALETLPRVEKRELVAVEIVAGYADVDTLRRLLATHDAIVTGEQYGEQVVYTADVPADVIDAIDAELLDRTAGRVRLRRCDG